LFDGCNWCPSCSKERYWSDFYNDPPDCEDPCDCYGNYKACKGCSWGRKPRGQKYREYNEVPQEETIMEGEEGTVTGDRVVPSNQQRTNKVQPTPANQPHKAVRPDTASTN
jgi:hypothetical protein